MREKHARFISEEDFVQKDPQEEIRLMAKFGNFTAETIWLDEDLQGITMYVEVHLQELLVSAYIHQRGYIALAEIVPWPNSSHYMDLVR